MDILSRIRMFFPIIAALLLLLFSSVPIHIPGVATFFPAVDIMVIYYWVSYRPDSLPDWFIFLLGILRDVLEGVSLGVGALVYLIVRLMVSASRDAYRKGSFPVVWQGMAVVTIVAIAVKWMLISFVMNVPVSLTAAIMQVLFSISIYPVVHWFFNLIQAAMPDNYQDV